MSQTQEANILLVDDIPSNIQIAANLLKKEGYDVSFALDGATALEHLESHHYDIILLDIMMPKMDGFEVVRRLKKNEKTAEIPVMFLTAKTDIESIKRGFNLGGVDYITKPFNAEELLARVKNQLQLQRQKAELYELNATKNRFFSLISHDLRTPCANIFQSITYLKKELPDDISEKAGKMLSLIEESARHSNNLLQNLLDWSRSQLDHIQMHPEWLPLLAFVEEEVPKIIPQKMQNKHHVEINIDPAVHLRADRDMLGVILRNLISNAQKYTPDGGTITISGKAYKDHTRLTVSDNGIGMTESTQDKLFRIEENISTQGLNKEKGTGLGLLLVKEFVDKHNGKINVKSQENQGSAFHMSFPVNG